jgi:hypothetical protein
VGRPRKPESEKAVRVKLYLPARAAAILLKRARETPGPPTLSGLCSSILVRAAERVAEKERARAARLGLRSVDETAGIERGPDGLPSRLSLG